jgi:acyl carrier protein
VAATIEERLVGVFRAVFGDDDIEISDATSASDIPEWDSLANINLLFALEQEFGLRFRDDEYASFTRVGELRAFLEARA